MGVHERAWDGLSICIYGATPMRAMDVEQAISKAAPGNEVRVQSFEDFGDAKDFCKVSQGAGLLLIEQNCGELPLEQAFQELASFYETKGMPCFAVVYHDGPLNPSVMHKLLRMPKVLDYVPINRLTDHSQTGEVVGEVWQHYVGAFEHHHFPQPLQHVLTAFAAETTTHESIAFFQHSAGVLTGKLNVSWLESVAVRWSHVLHHVEKHHHSALVGHPFLKQMHVLAPLHDHPPALSELGKGPLPLVHRVALCASALTHAFEKGELHNLEKEVRGLAKPGAPALHRHLATQWQSIAAFSPTTTLTLRRAG